MTVGKYYDMEDDEKPRLRELTIEQFLEEYPQVDFVPVGHVYPDGSKIKNILNFTVNDRGDVFQRSRILCQGVGYGSDYFSVAVDVIHEEPDEATGVTRALQNDIDQIAQAHDEKMFSGPLPPIDRGGWTSAEADAVDRGRKLYDIVTKWRDDNGVWNGEVIALYDHVRETFDDLIFDLINTVGYAPEPPEED